MGIPEVLSLFDEFATGIASFSSILKGDKSSGVGFVGGNLPGGVLGVGVDSQVLEHVDASDVVELGLHNSFKLGVLGEVEFISVVHLLEFRHELVH